MPRIAGVPIPEKRPISIALTEIYGIGRTKAKAILQDVNIDNGKLAENLTPEEVNKIRKHIEGSGLVEGELRRQISGNIKLLRDLGTYRGTRHIKKLPVRGQKTKTNSRTVRGNVRRTVTSGRRKLEKT